MEWLDVLKHVGTVGGVLFSVYGAGRGAKAARDWYRRRHDERVKRLRDGQ